ncbi:hypothetical protein BLNAU_12994 [Blattamonas nauphoetae]|uniref:Calponin-homology (CH) domain-containing protein n=1 Tax=Blattamonas nauphoetae TaxID=2049346 RepID=A0ABQ9XLD2_9EUKA|nr:hypothetical protein BLNAU_12994 [Blattamonas nauphoetae]
MSTNMDSRIERNQALNYLRNHYRVMKFLEQQLGTQSYSSVGDALRCGAFLEIFNKLGIGGRTPFEKDPKEVFKRTDNIRLFNNICHQHFQIPKNDWVDPMQGTKTTPIPQGTNVMIRVLKILRDEGKIDTAHIPDEDCPSFNDSDISQAQKILENEGKEDSNGPDKEHTPADSSSQDSPNIQQKTQGHPKSPKKKCAVVPVVVSVLIFLGTLGIAVAILKR